jgi:uncharacterized damage-inducible protein DinB
MSTVTAGKPATSEYASFYGSYIARVADDDIVAVLENQMQSTRAFLETISDEQGDKAYAPGKWSVKELIGHVIDSERVFAYRALRFARNDQTALPGFDQETFTANANFANRLLSDVVQEFEAVRRATVLLFKHLSPDAWHRRGSANGNEITVLALAFVIAGHELHHMDVLKTRYL